MDRYRRCEDRCGNRGGHREEVAVINVLVMCTANRCRSPIVEGLLKNAVSGFDIAVTSAGFLDEGRPAESGAIRATHSHGIDISMHRSRSVTSAMLQQSDLIITMEVAHLMSINELNAPAYRRSFTVLELDRAWRHAAEPSATLAQSLEQLASSRSAAKLLAQRSTVEVPDPMGRNQRAFDATVDLVAPSVHRIANELIRWSTPVPIE
jgi:protein-tyrosine phosphatase